MKKINRKYSSVMNMSNRLAVWVLYSLVFSFAVACSHAQEPTQPHRGLEVPAIQAGEQAIYNQQGKYWLLYAPEYKLSKWVAYTLTLSDITRDTESKDDEWKDWFVIDPKLKEYGWESAKNTDYTNSGYNRGHLVPSADRQSSEEANRATYLYSNAAPQLPELNQRAWKMLEAHLRTLLTENDDTLYIVTGGVLKSGLPVIGEGKVAVPELFYKAVVMRNNDGDLESVAYVMPNDTEKLEGKKYDNFKVTVDSVERLTGLDLFPRIDGL